MPPPEVVLESSEVTLAARSPSLEYSQLPGQDLSNEYKKIHDVDEFDNNWYEYVEFGTTNPLTILLQRNGFSRESATFIKKHKNEYVVHDGSTDELRLRLSLLNCGNTSVMTEAASIRFNAPKLFLEEED